MRFLTVVENIDYIRPDDVLWIYPVNHWRDLPDDAETVGYAAEGGTLACLASDPSDADVQLVYFDEGLPLEVEIMMGLVGDEDFEDPSPAPESEAEAEAEAGQGTAAKAAANRTRRRLLLLM